MAAEHDQDGEQADQHVELVARSYDQLGFDAVDNSPLSESWRSAPGTPMWHFHDTGQRRGELVSDLGRAERVIAT